MLTKDIRTVIKGYGDAIEATRNELQKLETAYADMRLKALRTVEMTKTGETVTLTFGDKVFKAKKNPRYNRWVVSKNGKKLISEYMWGIHDLRFEIAMGKVK